VKNRVLLACLLLLSGFAHGQLVISGRIVDDVTGLPLAGVRVSTDYPDAVVTGDDGAFSVKHVTFMDVRLTLEMGNLQIHVDRRLDALQDQSFGDVRFNMSGGQSNDRELPSITLDEGDQDEGI